jgi:hypothetical protein
MVTMPGILTPTPVREVLPPEYGLGLERHKMEKLGEMLSNMKELVQPLALIGTRKQLRAELDRKAHDYLHLKNEAWRLILKQLSEDQIVPSVSQLYHEVSNSIGRDTVVLGLKERSLLIDIIDSLREMFETLAEGFSTNQPQTTDILLECLTPLVRVDMCTFAIGLVLEGEIREWDATAIKLLCRETDRYMLEIEDVFLMHDKELEARLRKRLETISLQEVRERIGLSG